jgi:hypothetical protein
MSTKSSEFNEERHWILIIKNDLELKKGLTTSNVLALMWVIKIDSTTRSVPSTEPKKRRAIKKQAMFFQVKM